MTHSGAGGGQRRGAGGGEGSGVQEAAGGRPSAAAGGWLLSPQGNAKFMDGATGSQGRDQTQKSDPGHPDVQGHLTQHFFPQSRTTERGPASMRVRRRPPRALSPLTEPRAPSQSTGRTPRGGHCHSDSTLAEAEREEELSSLVLKEI